ncbi:MAG: redoxin domain-containing protein [Ferruginibacter sp.]
MKNIMIFCAAILISNSSFLISDILPIGSSMPKADVKMKDVSGKDILIKDVVKDNGILVMFSCNTCPYVIKNQIRTVAVSAYAQKMKVGVIILNSNEAYRSGEDSFEEMKAYAKKQKYKWNYVVDKNHQVADAFGAKRTPECFLFDKNLKLVYHGAIDDNPSDADAVKEQHLKNAIDLLTAGKEVIMKETKSVGCSIKRNN